MSSNRSISEWFGADLAELLGGKIKNVYSSFNLNSYSSLIRTYCEGLSYTKRIELHSSALKDYLPNHYPEAINILMQILGEENPKETGMFKNYYWILPIGKFVERFGLDYFDLSINAIAEITKRNTGEYAIRPYIRRYPNETLEVMHKWSKSDNFHLRRLASEGLRPKLPWSSKLDLFISNNQPVFCILENLMEDEVKFVQKSVANNIRDYLKVNKNAAQEFINNYVNSENENTKWILKHALRKPEKLK